jgi:hypothetical protein
MTKKQYGELARIIEGKCENSWLAVDITDFLEANFDNFNREKFMVACGFDKTYTYDELLKLYFDAIGKCVNQRVKVFTRN